MAMINYYDLLSQFVPTNEDLVLFEQPILDEIIKITLTNMRNYNKLYDRDYLINECDNDIETALKNKQIIVSCNVDVMNTVWKNDPEYYIYRKLTKKYICSKRNIMSGNMDEPPKIGIIDNLVMFTNGRHRFANLRDNGVKYIPIIISNGDLEQLIALKIVESN